MKGACTPNALEAHESVSLPLSTKETFYALVKVANDLVEEERLPTEKEGWTTAVTKWV